MQEIVIIGGGLAGLVSALELSKAGRQVILIEKKGYPFHKVCGEYVSNEVLPYLHRLGLNPSDLGAATIHQFLLSSPKGNTLTANLATGGFGLSRYTLDNHLYEMAKAAGVSFKLHTSVNHVTFADDTFTVQLSDGGQLEAKVVLGAYGKRTNLDRQLNRRFFRMRSPYIGVKYHIRYPAPANQIALHNFKDGYAGISAVEGGTYCLCYLTTRQNLKQHGTIAAMEQAILYQNPHLKHIFETAEFLFEQPEVINEITFATKTCIENHILMCGDAAGMITPLCGNGMAIAIHTGKLAAEHVQHYFSNGHNRQQLEQNYARSWKNQFENRLRVGRTVQRLFGAEILSEVAVGTLKYMPAAVKLLIAQTHGKPF
ncbi:NAD(P)/FAD-dependent oxidoreductase [Pontibacter arcticus]|uniref:FAD-dependent oxidoreductase n=1 Tax=Pontibacter arcticus TaxID=2080288 RepID=A0A364RJQ3_9BACT|nr:NAD(P)/FAD-dependent oxidoreductase [Pontibacter arcticus]RAU84505.1 FAD-dependent oxidoreductase [Pontibacter arcticus]